MQSAVTLYSRQLARYVALHVGGWVGVRSEAGVNIPIETARRGSICTLLGPLTGGWTRPSREFPLGN